jgi:hypothetical protein
LECFSFRWPAFFRQQNFLILKVHMRSFLEEVEVLAEPEVAAEDLVAEALAVAQAPVVELAVAQAEPELVWEKLNTAGKTLFKFIAIARKIFLSI